MKNSPEIFIPHPCHENWDAMSPAERGRHCAVCDKVVHDFRGMLADAIDEVIAKSPKQVCGRVDATAVSPNPFVVQVLAKFPVERLRVFVLAFVMAFGLEVWGISTLQAQIVQPAVEALQMGQNLESALQDSSKQIRIQGIVQDVYTREPVAMASVAAYQGNNFIIGTLTNAEGKFELVIPKSAILRDTFDLHLSYLGKTRKDVGIHSDIREFAYLIDASMFLEGVSIQGRTEPWVVGVLISPRMANVPGLYNEKSLYRPLDEWLMMHNSEVHHSGRW